MEDVDTFFSCKWKIRTLNYQDDENNDDEKLQLLQAKTKKNLCVHCQRYQIQEVVKSLVRGISYKGCKQHQATSHINTYFLDLRFSPLNLNKIVDKKCQDATIILWFHKNYSFDDEEKNNNKKDEKEIYMVVIMMHVTLLLVSLRLNYSPPSHSEIFFI